jgi:hypothetical protein
MAPLARLRRRRAVRPFLLRPRRQGATAWAQGASAPFLLRLRRQGATAWAQGASAPFLCGISVTT